MPRIHIPLMLILCAIAGCGGGGGGSPTAAPGALSFVYAGTPRAGDAVIDVGNIPTTTTLNFGLKNTGGTTVANVAILTPDPTRYVPSVGTIASIAPGATATFTLTIVNGRNVTNTGPGPTLHDVVLPRITLGADSATADTSVTVAFTPLWADFAVSWIGSNMPLLVPASRVSMFANGASRSTAQYTSYFTGSVPSATNAFSISNQGVVPITVHPLVFNSSSGYYEPSGSITISAYGTWTAFTSDTNAGNPIMRFAVDSAGTVFHSEHIAEPDPSGVWYGIMQALPAPPG